MDGHSPDSIAWLDSTYRVFLREIIWRLWSLYNINVWLHRHMPSQRRMRQAGYDHVSNEVQSSMLMTGAAEKFVDTAVSLVSKEN